MKKKDTILIEKKDAILILSLNVLLLSFGGFIANATSTKISIPLGVFLMLIPFIVDGVFIEIIQIKALRETIRGNNKGKDIFGKIICLIFWSIILINLTVKCYSAMIDLINGPKEVIICDAQIKYMRTSRYKMKKYFLIGETSSHEHKSIWIRGEKSKENITKLLEEDNKIKVYYFEELNTIYNVEIYQ